MSASGYCVTCAHVVKGRKEFFVRVATSSGGFEVCKAELFAIDEEIDMAVLKLETGKYQSCALLDIPRREMGNDIVIMGYPFGDRVSDDIENLSLSITKGYVSSWQKKKGNDYALLDIAAKAGNSGSPVIDVNSGRVIGILCGSILQENGKITEEINYMNPISLFYERMTCE